MKHLFSLVFITLATFSLAQNKENAFNSNWLFFKDQSDSLTLNELVESKFRSVNLPHDWSIEDLPNPSETVVGPFTKKSIGKKSTGFTVGGTAWYLKKFATEKKMQDKITTIHFDGIYKNADVWINGQHLGNHPYGYTPFFYDISKFLNPAGKQNVIAIQVKNWGKNSRWYSGSGIYRSVSLDIKNKVSIPKNGLYVTTPKITLDAAQVDLKIQVQNLAGKGDQYQIITTIIGPDNSKLTSDNQKITLNEALSSKNVKLQVNQPKLWDLQSPNLYTAVVEVYKGNSKIDEISTKFGIRTISFDVKNGFQLNGKTVKLKGGSVHHDNGILGSAAYSAAELRKVHLLKDNGFNAIRLSHNPSSTTFLQICDELGMLVIDEAFDMWERLKNKQDYSVDFKEWWEKDLEAMILRDRNHPSIIMWSIGNEIYERADSSGLEIGQNLVRKVKELDATRPTTEAICAFIGAEGDDWQKTPPAFALIDIAGYNYKWTEYENDHRKYPNRMIYGSESYPCEAFENWNKVLNLDYVIGDFVWTAQDYLGEAALANVGYVADKNDPVKTDFPWINAWSGDLDLIGEKKPQSYFRDVLWEQSPIQILVHEPTPKEKREVVSKWGWPNELPQWNWEVHQGEKLNVRVISKAPKVRLKLNGKIIGEKEIDKTNGIVAEFKVPFQPGKLEASNIIDGKETDKIALETFGDASKLEISSQTWQFQEEQALEYILVELKDDKGNTVTNQDVEIKFSLEGDAKIVASGNANPKEVQSYHDNKTTTFQGKCLVIVSKANKGKSVQLTAKSAAFSTEIKL